MRAAANGERLHPAAGPEAAMSVCRRIVVGVDGSETSLEALRQARRLLAPGGSLLAAAAYDSPAALRAGRRAEAVVDALARQAEEGRAAAARALEGLDGAGTRVVRGPPARTLLELAEREGATLLAVGTRAESRAAGVVLGSVATRLLHDAPCSVLVARPPRAPAAFPSFIRAGVDGSPESLAAAAAAAELAVRCGASVHAVAATGGKPVEVDGLVKLEAVESAVLAAAGRGQAAATVQVPLLGWSERPAVEALISLSSRADLLVLGSRGLHGFAALGSVSERVAHRARCSVLVVRDSPPAGG